MMMMMKDDDSRSLKADAERMAEELKKEQEQRKLLEDELKADLRTLTNASAAAAEQIAKLEMDWQTASDAKAVAEAGVRELREMLEQQQGKLQVDLKAAAEALAPAERQISQLRRDSDWEQQRAENARADAGRKIKELRDEHLLTWSWVASPVGKSIWQLHVRITLQVGRLAANRLQRTTAKQGGKLRPWFISIRSVR